MGKQGKLHINFSKLSVPGQGLSHENHMCVESSNISKKRLIYKNKNKNSEDKMKWNSHVLKVFQSKL